MAAQPPPPVVVPPPVPPRGVPAAAPPGMPGEMPALGMEGEHADPMVPLSFWQQPWVQNVLPFVTSLALHAAIVILGLTVYKVVETVSNQAAVQEQVTVPEATAEGDVPGGVENPGIGGDPTRAAAQDEYPDQGSPDGWAPQPGESLVAEAPGGGEGDNTDRTIGYSLAGGGYGKGKGFGTGEGDGTGSGTGSGRGKLAPYGIPGGGIPGPRGKIFGNGGQARTIAFCCDSSGSMVDKISALKNELVKAIEGLRPVQQFSLVFFSDERAKAFEDGNLVAATSENKRKAIAWLEEITTSSTSDPIPGLEVAFRSRPELLYMLTDGDFPDNAAVLARIEKLNPGKQTRVNTIAFVTSSEDETSRSFIDFLTRVAEQNRGQFRLVGLNDLD